MNEDLQTLLDRSITPYLRSDDDPAFWRAAIEVLFADVELLMPPRESREVFIQIGACSHWRRPNQTRWTEGGGFAWPMGYIQKYDPRFGNRQGPVGAGLPELGWFVLAHWNRELDRWEVIEPKFFGKRRLVFRAALPTGTRRNPQGAIHTIWTPGSPVNPAEKLECLYGFRKVRNEWRCVATSESLDSLVRDVQGREMDLAPTAEHELEGA